MVLWYDVPLLLAGRSSVVGAKEHWSRTSTGTFLPRAPRAGTTTAGNLKTLVQIERKIAAAIQFPPENFEPLYVLNYAQGQKYEPHYGMPYSLSLSHCICLCSTQAIHSVHSP